MFNSLNSDGLPLYDSDIISAKLYAEAEKRGKEKEFADLWKQLNNCHKRIGKHSYSRYQFDFDAVYVLHTNG